MKLPEIELTLKFKGAKKSELRQIKTSRDCADIMREIFNADTFDWFEEFVMVCLNQAQKVIGFYKVSSGGMTATLADLRIIATVALNSAATHVVIAHNHPSGSIRPSDADKSLTQRVKDGLALLDIKLIDHIILTDESFFSFSDEGYL